MKYFVSFLSGALVGAIVALLMAPASGEELRAQIGERAEAELKKAETEWNRALTELNVKLEDVRHDLKTLAQRSEAPEIAEAEAEAEPVA
jgi:gas vesicle protein